MCHCGCVVVGSVWLRDSWNHYDSVAHSIDASAAGVQIISGAVFQNTPSPVNFFFSILSTDNTMQYSRKYWRCQNSL